MKILVSWIGMTDLRASKELENAGIGPIGQAVTNLPFDKVVLISNYSKEENTSYINWLQTKTNVEIEHHYEALSSPTNYEEIYNADVKVVNEILKSNGSDISLTFHISPGTPAMQTIWIILAKTRFEAELIETSKELGLRTPYIPFEIDARFIPKLTKDFIDPKSHPILEKLISEMQNGRVCEIFKRSEQESLGCWLREQSEKSKAIEKIEKPGSRNGNEYLINTLQGKVRIGARGIELFARLEN